MQVCRLEEQTFILALRNETAITTDMNMLWSFYFYYLHCFLLYPQPSSAKLVSCVFCSIFPVGVIGQVAASRADGVEIGKLV